MLEAREACGAQQAEYAELLPCSQMIRPTFLVSSLAAERKDPSQHASRCLTAHLAVSTYRTVAIAKNYSSTVPLKLESSNCAATRL